MIEQESTTVFAPEDIEKNKVISALAYFIFFLPLIVSADSKFGRFHANQGLLLLITAIAGSIILGLIPIIGWVLLPLFSLAIFVLAIVGLVGAINGKAKDLPIIGKYRLIK